jgi:hypothetical protein
MHPTASTGEIMDLKHTVYAMPMHILASKGGITDPDQPCYRLSWKDGLRLVFINFCSNVCKEMLGKCSGLNLIFVTTSSILSPLSYDISAWSHPAMNSANDLEKSCNTFNVL